MLGPSGKPTPRLRASVIREELSDRLARLQELERWNRLVLKMHESLTELQRQAGAPNASASFFQSGLSPSSTPL